MGKKVRCEFISVRPEILQEIIDEKTNDRTMRVRIKFQHADIVNKNGRLYTKELLQREMDRLAEGVVEGAVFGASYHPAGADAEVNDVSHIWNKLWMEEDGSCMGEATILPTTNGKDAQIIIKHGGRIGISSRGTGTVTKRQKNGQSIEQVNNDYHMLSPGDMVLAPSVPGANIRAMIEKTLTESYFSEEDETQTKKTEDSKSIEQEIKMSDKFKTFETEEEYESHLKERQAEFLTSASFKKAVKEAVNAEKEKWTKAITAELEPKIEAVQKEQTAMIEKVRDAVNGLTAIPGVIPEEDATEEEVKEEKEKVDEDLKQKIKDLEKTIADLEKDKKDKEDSGKKKKENEKLQVALKAKITEELEKDEYKAYKPLIESELIKENEVVGIETVEAVEEAVKATYTRLSELKVRMDQVKIIESGIVIKGKQKNVDEDTTVKEALAILKEKFESSKKAGYSGNFEDFKKQFAK